eukprot:scaffold655_cov162-Amphora_coffeaeformis.AAC.19
MSTAGNRQAATVIDLMSPEMDRRGAARRPDSSSVEAGVAAMVAGAHDIVEILSDDDDDDNPPRAITKRQRCGKRQRDHIGIAPFQDNNGTGRLKDYDEEGRKKTARKSQNDHDIHSSTPEIIDLMSVGGNHYPSAAATVSREQVTPASLPPELQALEVYPDADEDAVKTLLRQHNQKIEVVVAIMSENGYTKSSVEPATFLNLGNGIIVSMAKTTNDWSYDFMAADSFTPSEAYIKQATSQLLYDFPFLRTIGGDVIMKKNSNHYAKAHDFVVTILKGTGGEEQKFSRLDRVIRGAEPSDEQATQLNSHSRGKTTGIVYKRKNQKPRAVPTVADEILVEEISYVHGKLREYLQNGRKHESVEKKKAAAQKSNTAIDCACCFDGYDIDDMVACKEEAHLFCADCLRAYAENQIFGVGNLGVDRRTKRPAHELKCFQGDCASGFDRKILEKALPQKTLEKYDSIQCSLALQAAGLECMVECPKCGFKVELSSDQKILICPVGSCKYESCRECGEAAHIPLRCDEVEKKEETTGRITVEEAISRAKIRHCPKCNKAFLKESGCNKITCGCGHKICYVCRASVKDYSHFCQKPHCQHKKCGKCVLWTNVEQDDARAMREAGIKAASEVTTKEDVVETLLKPPPTG